MKKIYLPLFAAAMLASCSNEMNEFAVQAENGEGFKVDLTVVENQPETRITWGETGAPVWDKVDKFSVMKIGAQNMNESFKVVANAAYTTENGANFTSENVLFVGKHVLVYPLMEDVYNLNQEVRLVAGTDGDKGLGANSIFVGSDLLDVTKEGITVDGKVYNDAGYHKTVKVSVRAASAGFIFNLKEVNALALEEGDPAVEITKVELRNKANKPFATQVTLQNENAGGTGKVLTKATDLKSDVYSTFEAMKLEEGAKAEIVALPSQATTQAEGDYEIVITTNYGIVTIDKAIDVTNKDGKIQIAAGPTEKSETNANDNLSFAKELATMMDRTIKGEAQPRVLRNVNVDMSTADISGLEIKTSEQLIAAYRAFDLMGKKTTDNVQFTLIATDNKFTLTKAAIDVITKHAAAEKAILDYSSISQLIITGYEEGFIPVIDQMTPGTAELVLADDNKLKLDVNSAAAVNVFTKITNKGELQLTQGTATTLVVPAIFNEGTITFAGAETTVPTYLQNNGTIDVAGEQTVKMTSAEFNDKSIANIKGELISSTYVAIYPGATVNVEGNLLNITGQTLANAGTINILNADAQVILSANEVAGNKGTVYVTAKDNNLKTGSAAGYVKLPVSDDEFVMNAENMGIANYIEFSGSKLNMDIQSWNAYVELKSDVKITAAAAKVGLFVVNKDVDVTVADGAKIATKEIDNKGKIFNYGTFTYSTGNKGTIYDL